jgi:hypothetical protein
LSIADLQFIAPQKNQVKALRLLYTDLPVQLRQEDGSREKYQRFFDEMDKDGSKTIEYAILNQPMQIPHLVTEQLYTRMVELAARHGYEMDGRSLAGSEEASVSSSSKFSERYPSAFKQKRDHKGVSADDMRRIFATLVCRRGGDMAGNRWGMSRPLWA